MSANMGGGHNATAAALEESVRRVWPGSDILRVDSLDVMGAGVGRLFRAVYVANVETTPWLYEFFYAALWRHRWFAHASKRFTGSWCGRRLAPRIDAFDPDLILSTYPLGSAGLDWLIRHHGLAARTGCWISDFAAHPFWVYPAVDVNFVMDAAALPGAHCAEPLARLAVSALPVVSGFHPADQTAARRRLGLRPDAYVPLVACGAYAFGDVATLVRTLTEVSDRVQVVAVCGHNEAVRRRLADLGTPRDRLLVLGWTDDMPGIVQASDLVVGNAGGATALEALAVGVPVVLTRPIPAHGRANADLMTVAGVSDLCVDESALAAYARAAVDRRASTHPTPSRSVPAAASTRPNTDAAGTTDSGYRSLDDDLLLVAGDCADRSDRTATPRPRVPKAPGAPTGSARRPWPMRPADAFFAHVDAENTPQELGVVLDLGSTPSGRPATLADIRASMQARSALPSMRRVLIRDPPGWAWCEAVEVANHIDEQVLPAGATPEQAWVAAGDLWSRPLPSGRPAWQMRLIRAQDTDAGLPTLFAIKMHHCQGDGISALGLLDRLLDPAADDPLVERRSVEFADRRVEHRLAAVRGIARLAARGFAPHHPDDAAVVSPQRDLVGVPLPWSLVRRLAADLNAQPIEVVIAVAADTLRRMLVPVGLVDPRRPLRAMVPVAMRAARLDREFGNWTGSLVLDLPMRDQSLHEQVRQVRRELRLRAGHGEAQGAAAVMRAAGLLPVALHRAFARAVYHRRFFNTVVSYMPGAKRSRWLVGAPVRAMYPVLPLPPGVRVTVGAIVAGGTVGIGVLLDRQLGLDRSAVEQALQDARAGADVSAFGAANPARC